MLTGLKCARCDEILNACRCPKLADFDPNQKRPSKYAAKSFFESEDIPASFWETPEPEIKQLSLISDKFPLRPLIDICSSLRDSELKGIVSMYQPEGDHLVIVYDKSYSHQKQTDNICNKWRNHGGVRVSFQLDPDIDYSLEQKTIYVRDFHELLAETIVYPPTNKGDSSHE